MRVDQSVAQQLVQSNHAVFEVGLQYQIQNAEPPSVIIVEIKNKHYLEKEIEYLKNFSIDTFTFFEPYQDIGLTAFATRPILEHERRIFSHYPLWGKSLSETKKIKKAENINHLEHNDLIVNIQQKHQKSLSKINHVLRQSDIKMSQEELSLISSSIQEAQKLTKKINKF